MAQQAFALGCFLEGQTAADSQAMSLGRWAGGLGLLPVEMALPPWVCAWHCCQAATGRSRPSSCCRRALARSGKQILVQLSGRNCHFLMSAKKKSLLCRWADSHTQTRDTARDQPHRGCAGPPAGLFALGRLSQSSQSSEGGGKELQAQDTLAQTAVPQNPQQYNLPSALPPVLASSPGLGNEPAGKGRALFLPL